MAASDLVSQSANVVGVPGWKAFQFRVVGNNKGALTLVNGRRRAQLDYHVEGNQLAVGPPGPHLGHEHWEMTYTKGVLLLRSLLDGDTIMLVR